MEPTDILGNIKLYNADCIEVMKTFKDKQFSLAIVDPPYGIDWMQQIQNPNTKANWKQYENKEWDKQTPTDEYWKQLFRVSKNQIVWGGNYMTDKLYPSPCWLIWDKMQEFSGAVFEMAWTSFKSPAKAFRMSRVEAYANQNKIHPTQKPVQLYKWLLQNYAKEGDTILDTHFGSLSIGIACHDMKFDLTAIELDKDYYEQAKQRLINHQRQLTLF
jgi:site-specific DNA-methyltransferase (adenine-specific)